MLAGIRFRSNLAMLTVVTGVAAFAAPAVAATPDAGPAPDNMAALGDSLVRAFNACGFFVDCSSQSWATGDSAEVDSQYLRIRSVNPVVAGHNHNDARSGATAADLATQARTAVDQHVDYVAILIGANDACTRTEAQMTAIPTFRTRIDAALDTLSAGLPDARVFVASIPDLKRLWAVEKDNVFARTVWAVGGICQAMLANPTSTAPADRARRDRVRQRVIDYNAQLAQSCASHPHCRFDGDAVFDVTFTSADISDWDHFHPGTAGQALLARVTWAAGFGW
ncbi:MAG TPA: SGNH/GDSL hydrolase family protein [Mycobacteriales bacterium]